MGYRYKEQEVVKILSVLALLCIWGWPCNTALAHLNREVVVYLYRSTDGFARLPYLVNPKEPKRLD